MSRYLSYSTEVIQYIADCDGKEVNIIHLGGSENLSKHEKVGYSLVASGYYEVPRNLLSYMIMKSWGKIF